jgi:hypothetical protein
MNWICQFCGGDTSDVEYEYLDGHNHLSCTLDYLKNNEVKKKLTISNPEKINSKNICLDKSIIEITYMGLNASVNADNETYTLYKFIANNHTKLLDNVIFEIHTNIINNKVQFNIWREGGVELNSLPVNVIRDRNELINRMIAEVKKS